MSDHIFASMQINTNLKGFLFMGLLGFFAGIGFWMSLIFLSIIFPAFRSLFV